MHNNDLYCDLTNTLSNWQGSLINLDTVDSTNNFMLRNINNNMRRGTLVIAESQTKGRGTSGKKWESPVNNLFLSIYWEFSNGQIVNKLSLKVAECIISALQQLGVENLSIKLPNDIMYEHSKLGGILIDTRANSHLLKAVIGIGLNIYLPMKYRKLIKQEVTDLYQITNRKISKNEIITTIMKCIIPLLQNYN